MEWVDKLSPRQRATAQKVMAAADRHGVPRELALGMAMQESGFDQSKRSKTGPTGVMMLGRAAAKDLKVDRHNEDQNIEGGVRFMKSLLAQYGGDVDKALVAYHDGPNSAFFRGGPMSDAARNHIQKVKGYAGMADSTVKPIMSVAPVQMTQIAPLDITGLDDQRGAVGSNTDIGLTDWLGAGAGAAAGAKFGVGSAKSQKQIEAERAAASRVKEMNREDILRYKAQTAAAQEADARALQLRKEAMERAQAAGKGIGQDPLTWMQGQYGSDIASVEGRGVLSQKEAEAAGKQGVQNVRRAQAVLPGAGPDPRTGLWLPHDVLQTRPAAIPQPSLTERFPMPQPAPRPEFPAMRPIPEVRPGSAIGTGRNIVFGGLAGQQAAAAGEKGMQGDYTGAGLSGLTSGAATAAMAPQLSPKARAAAAATAAGGAGLTYLLNLLRGEEGQRSVLDKEEPVQKFQSGGKVGAAKKLVGAALEGPLAKVFDPRFDKRVEEQAKLMALRPNVEWTGAQNVPTVSLANFEGSPFITSMSDRTAAGGNLLGVNDLLFKRPVALKGGQDYMFNNPGQVWASDPRPVGQIMREAERLRTETGKDPLYLPWRMAPTGGDFAHMTGQSMLAQAEVALNKNQKRSLDKQMRALIPDWQGIDSPMALEQFANSSGNTRKAVKQVLDRDYRNMGGLGLGEARLAVADPKQVAAPEGGLMNLGKIFADRPVITKSGHESYPFGVPGEGVGRLDRDIQVYQMLPQAVTQRGMADAAKPSAADLRALQMKPYSGIITDQLLKSLGY